MAPEAVSLDLAMELLSWPRDLGFPTEALLQSLTMHSPDQNASQPEQQPVSSQQQIQPAIGEMVQAGFGRFGYFVKQGDVFAAIPKARKSVCCCWALLSIVGVDAKATCCSVSLLSADACPSWSMHTVESSWP